MGGNIMNQMVDDAASLGSITSWIWLIVGIIITIACCTIGGYLVFNNSDDEWKNITGTVSSAICDPITTTTTNNNNTTTSTSTSYNCTLKVNYQIGDSSYEDVSLIMTSSSMLEEESSVTFQYKISEPGTIRSERIGTSVIGFILCGVGSLVLFIAGLNWFLTKHSKLYAAGSGAKTVVDIFT